MRSRKLPFRKIWRFKEIVTMYSQIDDGLNSRNSTYVHAASAEAF